MANDEDKKIGVGEGEEISTSRRSALLKLGLAGLAIYTAPAILTLSEAEADDRRSRRSRKSRKSRRRPNRNRRSRKSRNSRRSRRS